MTRGRSQAAATTAILLIRLLLLMLILPPALAAGGAVACAWFHKAAQRKILAALHYAGDCLMRTPDIPGKAQAEQLLTAVLTAMPPEWRPEPDRKVAAHLAKFALPRAAGAPGV